MKKLIALGTGLVMVALVATPVLARTGWHHRSSSDVENKAVVHSEVYAGANTGGNSQNTAYAEGTFVKDVEAEVENNGDNTIRTGDADAEALGVVVANTHLNDELSCGRCASGDREDEAYVGSTVEGVADTGHNYQNDAYAEGVFAHDVEAEVENGYHADNSISTGDASADAVGVSVVNTHVRWFGL